MRLPIVFPCVILFLTGGSVAAQEPQQPPPILRLMGQVLDGDTRGEIAGAIVSIVRNGRSISQDTADDRGFFRVEAPYQLAARSDAVRASADGYLPQSPHVQLGCGSIVTRPGEQGYCDIEANFYLQATKALFRPSLESCAFHGQVIDAKGKPVAHAMVSIEGDSSQVTADSTGIFKFEGVASGLRTATAAMIGYYYHAKTVLVACHSDEQSRVKIQLFGAAIW